MLSVAVWVFPPPVAVTVTRYNPVPAVALATVALKGALTVPPAGRTTLLGMVNGSVALPGVPYAASNLKAIVAERVMVAAKLLMLSRPKNVPAGTIGSVLSTTIVSPTAAIEKSGTPTFTMTAVEWLPTLPVPVTVTVYAPEAVPVGILTVRVEVPVGVTMFGDSVAVSPAGDTVAARFTVPVKPEILVTVIVDVTDVPCEVLKLDGLAAMLKPGAAISTGTVTLWEIEVPDPVTVTEPVVVPLTVSVVVAVPSAVRKRPVSEVLPVRPEVAVVAKLMKSLNPPKLVSVMVEVAGVPDPV